MTNTPKWALLLALLTPLLLILAVYLAGRDYGLSWPAILLFPWPLIGTLLPNSESITTLMMLVALLQYPVYGFLLDFTKDALRFKRTLATITLIHFSLVVVLLIFAPFLMIAIF